MVTIEELISGQADAVSSASQNWDDSTLEIIRQSSGDLTAYDQFLRDFQTMETFGEEG